MSSALANRVTGSRSAAWAGGDARRAAAGGSPRRSPPERPGWVLVYGDTNSTLGRARAAAEAACRSPTSRRGCGATTCRCRRSTTGSRPTGSPSCSSARRALRGDAAKGGRLRADRGDRRRDGGRELSARSGRARALGDPRPPGAGVPAVRGRHAPSRGETWRSRGSGGCSKVWAGSRSASSSRLIRGLALRSRGGGKRRACPSSSRSATSTSPPWPRRRA